MINGVSVLLAVLALLLVMIGGMLMDTEPKAATVVRFAGYMCALFFVFSIVPGFPG